MIQISAPMKSRTYPYRSVFEGTADLSQAESRTLGFGVGVGVRSISVVPTRMQVDEQPSASVTVTLKAQLPDWGAVQVMMRVPCPAVIVALSGAHT